MQKASGKGGKKNSQTSKVPHTLGPVSDLERHLPNEWWKDLFNSYYLKTDGDVVENHANTVQEIDQLVNLSGISPSDDIVDLCCGQGRHSIELAKRGFDRIHGIDRSRYLIRLARKRAQKDALNIKFSEGDARQIKLPQSSKDCFIVMGNSFGYFEKVEDDLKVLTSIRRVLRPEGKIILDIVNGNWMAQNFEPRSWEWIDQLHFVNRERSLAADGKRIISREVITNSELGVIADQFYAERLYSFDEIKELLEQAGFKNVQNLGSVQGNSTRGQDLGMMANRMIVMAYTPVQKQILPKENYKKSMTVIMGDPRLPDTVKKDGVFNQEDLATIDNLKQALKQIDHIQIKYLDNHKTLIDQLIKNPPSFVFNLCDEGFLNNALKELHVPALLELLEIPYSGAGPGCLSLCYDKSKIRAIASNMEIPVPLETFVFPSDQAANIPSSFPALIKPSCGDSSIGITQNAVVYNAKDLVDYLDQLKTDLPNTPVLIQEFLQGAEYSVTLIGNAPEFEALPILEVDYSALPKDLPHILCYESKWDPASPYWKDIKYNEANLSEDLKNDLINYSKLLFERTECRDYARFDFRCDRDNVPKLLEVNPNPGWCWDGKVNLMAKMAGMTYSDLLNKIVNAAYERYERKS